MNKTELKKYIRSIKFWLLDYNKTYSKYEGYKTKKFNEWIMEYNNNTTINDFENMFSYSFNPYRNQLSITQENKSKSNIRALKTEINYIMRNDIENYIEWIFDDELNDNEKRSFTIKYYLKYYKKINKAMNNILFVNII